jgi:Saxitoxin biosynthesis operon protein SxtJ
MKMKKETTSLLVIIIGFLVLSFFIKNYWPLIIAAGICLPGFLIPAWASIIHKGWMGLAHILGWVNTRIILFVVYFIILTPIAFFARLAGKLSFKKHNKNSNTLFINREHIYGKTDLENPW